MGGKKGRFGWQDAENTQILVEALEKKKMPGFGFAKLHMLTTWPLLYLYFICIPWRLHVHISTAYYFLFCNVSSIFLE